MPQGVGYRRKTSPKTKPVSSGKRMPASVKKAIAKKKTGKK